MVLGCFVEGLCQGALLAQRLHAQQPSHLHLLQSPERPHRIRPLHSKPNVRCDKMDYSQETMWSRGAALTPEQWGRLAGIACFDAHLKHEERRMC